LEGFRDEVAGARSHRVHRDVDASERGHEQDELVRPPGEDRLHDVGLPHAGHPHVRDDEIERLAADPVQSLRRRRVALHAEAAVDEALGEELDDAGIVVEDEKTRAVQHGIPTPPASSDEAGKNTANVDPSPTRLSTSIRPPCASTIDLTIDSPRPVPPASAWPVKNGSKM